MENYECFVQIHKRKIIKKKTTQILLTAIQRNLTDSVHLGMQVLGVQFTLYIDCTKTSILKVKDRCGFAWEKVCVVLSKL